MTTIVHQLRQARPALFKLYIAIVYTFLLVPPLYMAYLSFFPTPSPIIMVPDEFTTKWYTQLFRDPSNIQAFKTTIIASATTAVVSTTLGLLAARGYMKASGWIKRALIPLYILPILIPGIIMGLSLLAFLTLAGISRGLLTLVISTILWTLPFAILILLTAMSNLNQTLRTASYDLGGSPLYTFWRVELPIILPGVIGAFLFSFLLSFNEYIRGSFVAGQEYTMSVLIYTTVAGETLPPEYYAASALLIFVTTLAMLVYIVYLRTQ